ncbi:MAG: hypothetical protein JWQ40_3676 [Segetibacter sp.]|jgi:hypothetical protein|nr:hypothetical protein [Segetibacter sp.]
MSAQPGKIKRKVRKEKREDSQRLCVFLCGILCVLGVKKAEHRESRLELIQVQVSDTTMLTDEQMLVTKRPNLYIEQNEL